MIMMIIMSISDYECFVDLTSGVEFPKSLHRVLFKFSCVVVSCLCRSPFLILLSSPLSFN